MTQPEPLPTSSKSNSNHNISLNYKPWKDTILILLSALLMGVILLATFLSKPNTSNAALRAEIRYIDPQTGQGFLLWDKDDQSRNTKIAFPTQEEKTLVFSKEESMYYLGEDHTFDFVAETVGVTLYSDQSIQIKWSDITCPNHDCSRFGRVYSTYSPIICLPNHIQVTIVAEGFPDFDA